MRRLLTAALLVALAVPAVASADPVPGPTRQVQQVAANAAAACRRSTPATDEQCAAVPLSPAVSEKALQDYEASSTHRALQAQFDLADYVPFAHAAWLGTHNSFNTSARDLTLSGSDANQQLSMTDQLRSDIRSLEVDVHWFPSAQAGGSYAPVVCHARGADQGHAGCTTEPLLSQTLPEIATWLRAHPRQVVLLYLEDHLDTDAGYTQAAGDLRTAFGSLLYSPGGTACIKLPLTRSRRDVLAAGAQVLVISGCHSGATWNGTVFSGSDRARDETGPAGYGEDGSCDPTRKPTVYDDRLLRVFEDSTALSATVDQGSSPITPGKARALQRCAVDITGFDQLLPGDPRLAASVWSWAPGQPAATGDCVVTGKDGWHAVGCTGRHAFACRTTTGWAVDTAVTPFASRRGRCAGGQVGAPRYGFEGVQLSAALSAARITDAWLSLVRSSTGWTAGDTAR